MKKILHVIDSLSTGGAEVLLIATIKQLPKFEHFIVMLEDKKSFPDVTDFAKVSCIEHKGWHHLFRSRKRLRKLVDDFNPDVVHAHLFLSSLVARLALPKYPNLVYTIHNLYGETVFRKRHLRVLESLVYSDRHKLIAVSKYILDDYKKVIRACQKGSVLYNFVDPIFLTAGVVKTEASELLHKWVAIGSLKAQKNYSGMISLFTQLNYSNKKKGTLYLDIYGEGPLKPDLQYEVERCNAPVFFKGRTSEVANLLPKYDAYLSTSLYEGYGIAPMEALACGVPIFISDIPVYREVYGNHAYYFDLNDRSGNSFLNAVAVYQQLSPEQKKHRRVSGINHAATIACCNAYLTKLLEIYNIG